MDTRRKKGLGRGLSALLNDDQAPAETVTVASDSLPVDRIVANPDQPRRRFAEDDLRDLADSIRVKGIIQPILVRPRGDTYEIVAGERRWRGAQAAGLHSVPVVIRELDDAEVLEIALIENVQRADLNPIEEAEGYHRLIDRHGYTQDRLAETIGKSRPHIANGMRLLKLPEEVRAMIAEGQLSAGHGRALLTMDDPVSAAKTIVSRGLNVRQAEALAKAAAAGTPEKAPRVRKDADTMALESDLGAALGAPVTIQHKGGKGRIVISYDSLDQLDDLCGALSRPRA